MSKDEMPHEGHEKHLMSDVLKPIYKEASEAAGRAFDYPTNSDPIEPIHYLRRVQDTDSASTVWILSSISQ